MNELIGIGFETTITLVFALRCTAILATAAYPRMLAAFVSQVSGARIKLNN